LPVNSLLFASISKKGPDDRGIRNYLDLDWWHL
jgi:hypothetical protein